MKTLKDIDLKGKRVFLRTDFNVSLDEAGNITDDERIVLSVPTIKHILKQKPQALILASHLGRPEGNASEKFKMDKVAVRVRELLKRKVVKLDDCIGEEINAQAKKGLFLLENLRFHIEEEKNDPVFAQKLSELAEVYVNDAFGASHRAHASVEAITHFLPSYAGLLMEKEMAALNGVLHNPQRPFIVVLGGAKVSDKIGVLDHLSQKADKILIGGAMMFTFYKAQGIDVGKSKFEPDKIEIAKKFLNEKIILPVDTAVADKFEQNASVQTVSVKKIPAEWMGLDIGKKTISLYKKELKAAKTILWNGPMGVFEFEKFAEGTHKIAKAIARSKVTTVAGGGETVAVIDKLKLFKKFTHVSTGGGAMLEFLEGKELPAVKALERNNALISEAAKH